MQTKEAKYKAAIARNEFHRPKYEAQAKKAGLETPEKIKAFVDQKIGIRKH